MRPSANPASPNALQIVQAMVLLLLSFLLSASFCLATLRPELDARALGMGGAWIAHAEGSASIFWNPSRLATVKHPEVFYDFSQGALAAALPVAPLGVLGISALDLHGTDNLLVENHHNPVGKFEFGYNQLIFSYARPIVSGFLIGGNIGSSRSHLKGSRWHINYDVGLWARLSKTLAAGARLTDIAGTQIADEHGLLLEEFPQQFGLGVVWNRLRWLHTTADLDTARWQLRIGGETGLPWLRLRLGVLADLDEPRSPFRWSTGLSLRYQRLELDYAYVDLDDRYHRLSMNWHFSHPTRRHYAEQEIVMDLPDVEKPPVTRREFHTPTRKPTNDTPLKSVPRTHQPPKSAAPVDIVRPEALMRVDPLPDPGDTWSSKHQTSGESLVEKLATQYRIEVPLILAVIQAESNFDPEVVSAVGAVGLTQLMPDTARSLGLRVPRYTDIKKPTHDVWKDERFHPRKNLAAGLAYLRALLDTYEDNYALAVSAYNAGPGRVTQHVPNIRETEKHVARVMNYYYQYLAATEKRRVAVQKLESVLRGGL